MWRLLDNEFKVKGANRTDPDVKVFFDKTQIMKTEEDWFSKLDMDGQWGPSYIMDAAQFIEFEQAIERGPCALPRQLRLYYWRALVPTPQAPN